MDAIDSTSKCCPIIVLGAERSGTSVVAEMVHTLENPSLCVRYFRFLEK